MGVHKSISNKVSKKSSKLDSVMDPSVQASHSKPKKTQSPSKPMLSKKKVSGSSSKTQANKVSASEGQSKSTGKVKVHSSGVAGSTKDVISQSTTPSTKGGATKTSAAQSKKVSHSMRVSRLESFGETVCREIACEGLSTSGGYCRMHYIKNWKKIKRKELILREKKLNQYIEELVIKYPDKYIEAIRQDLASDKDFAKVIYDLDLDEGVDDFDIEGGESVDALIDTIKRDFDDEGETY